MYSYFKAQLNESSPSLKLILIGLFLVSVQSVQSQIDEKKMGIWYKYAFNSHLNATRFGIQGDAQVRNWNISSELQQLILRSSVYYIPKNTRLKLSMGYVYSQSYLYDRSDIQNHENRLYQEVRFMHNLKPRIYFTHRFRFEQRFIQNEDFRTRYRYSLALSIPLNKKLLIPKTLYVTAYDEIFFNGILEVEHHAEIAAVDRNRIYFGFGYIVSPHIKITGGILHQDTENWNKNQILLSLYHTI